MLGDGCKKSPKLHFSKTELYVTTSKIENALKLIWMT